MLKNKHMDCLIPADMKEAHNESCSTFIDSSLSPLLGEMMYSFIKLPERDYILPVGYNIKIVPYIRNDFKYVVGVKYNRMDSNMYLFVNKDNQIDSFSYNMRYLFKEPDYYLDKNITLKELCPELEERLKRSGNRSTEKATKRNDSMEMTDARTGTHLEKRLAKSPIKLQITEKQGSMYDIGSDDEDDMDDELTRYIFKFKHSTSQHLMSKVFKV